MMKIVQRLNHSGRNKWDYPYFLVHFDDIDDNFRDVQATTSTLIGRQNRQSSSEMICYTPRSLVKYDFCPYERLTETFSTYLISTAIANQAKRNFYEEDVPKVEDVGLMLISSCFRGGILMYTYSIGTPYVASPSLFCQ